MAGCVSFVTWVEWPAPAVEPRIPSGLDSACPAARASPPGARPAPPRILRARSSASIAGRRSGPARPLPREDPRPPRPRRLLRSEEHTSELQSRENLVCRLLLEKKKKINKTKEHKQKKKK